MRKFLIFCSLFLFTFLLFGCDNKIDKKEVKDKVEYKTTDIYFDKIISTQVGDFASFKYYDSSHDQEEETTGGFYFLKMRKSEFNSDDVLDLVSNFVRENSHYKFYIIFDDSTVMRIDISDDLFFNFLSYSDLESRYIDFFDKYKDLENRNIVYKFPFSRPGDSEEDDYGALEMGDLSLLKDDDGYRFISTNRNGVFEDGSAENNPMNKDCILYPFIGVNIKDRDSN